MKIICFFLVATFCVYGKAADTTTTPATATTAAAGTTTAAGSAPAAAASPMDTAKGVAGKAMGFIPQIAKNMMDMEEGIHKQGKDAVEQMMGIPQKSPSAAQPSFLNPFSFLG